MIFNLANKMQLTSNEVLSELNLILMIVFITHNSRLLREDRQPTKRRADYNTNVCTRESENKEDDLYEDIECLEDNSFVSATGSEKYEFLLDNGFKASFWQTALKISLAGFFCVYTIVL